MDSQLSFCASGTHEKRPTKFQLKLDEEFCEARPLSGYSFLAVEERVTRSHGCELKTAWMQVSFANK